MSTWKDREKVGNMIEDCARGNLPVDDALDIIESLVNESTPTNTPTSKCCLICSGYGLTDCRRDKDCPCHTPTTDFKNSNDMTTPKHTKEEWNKEFDDLWEESKSMAVQLGVTFDSMLMRDSFKQKLNTTLIRIKEEERKATVAFIRTHMGELDSSTTFFHTVAPEVLEAALNSPEECCAINPDTGETPSHCSNHPEDN